MTAGILVNSEISVLAFNTQATNQAEAEAASLDFGGYGTKGARSLGPYSYHYYGYGYGEDNNEEEAKEFLEPLFDKIDNHIDIPSKKTNKIF